MGWWSTGVMSGDTPLDIADGTLKHLGVADADADGMYPLTAMTPEAAVALHAAFDGEDLAELADRYASYDAHVADQVIGVLAMAAGVPLGGFADRVRAAAAGDEWAASDESRRRVMDDLVAAVDRYDGRSLIVASPTLADALFA